MQRRDFLLGTIAAGTALSFADVRTLLARPVRQDGFRFEASHRALVMRALDAARSAGASYADVRINRNRTQSVSTRENQVTGLSDRDTMGIGIRVLVDGAWGFAGTRELGPDEVERAARQAVSQARGNARARRTPVELAPAAVADPVRSASTLSTSPSRRRWTSCSGRTRPPWPWRVRFVNSSMFFLREDKFFASTEGTVTGPDDLPRAGRS
jgi:TldD protein